MSSNAALIFKFQRNKMFLSGSLVKIQSCVEPPLPRSSEISPDHQGSNFKSCAWRAVSSHHPQEVFLTQFSLYVHKGGLRPHSVQIWHGLPDIGHINVDYGRWSRHSSRSKFITPKGTFTRRPTLFPRSAPETNRCQISGKFKLNMAYGPPFNRSKFINLKRHIYTDKGMCV